MTDASTYPGGIVALTDHEDDVEFIVAAHVNRLQNEVMAIERTLGINPQIWTDDSLPPIVLPYPDVVTRLNAINDSIAVINAQLVEIWVEVKKIPGIIIRLDKIEKDLLWVHDQITAIWAAIQALKQRVDQIEINVNVLINDMAWVKQQIQLIWDAINALRNLPKAYLTSSGTSVPPGSYNTTYLNFDGKTYDNAGVFNGGNRMYCPRTGWWQITYVMNMANNSGTADLPYHHYGIANLNINGNGSAAGAESMRKYGSRGSHLVTAVYAGPWYQGQYAMFGASQNGDGPNPLNCMTYANASFQFVTEL